MGLTELWLLRNDIADVIQYLEGSPKTFEGIAHFPFLEMGIHLRHLMAPHHDE